FGTEYPPYEQCGRNCDPFVGSRMRLIQLCRRHVGSTCPTPVQTDLYSMQGSLSSESTGIRRTLAGVWRTGLAYTRNRLHSRLECVPWKRLRSLQPYWIQRADSLARTVKRIGRDEAAHPIQSQDCRFTQPGNERSHVDPGTRRDTKSIAWRDHLSAGEG